MSPGNEHDDVDPASRDDAVIVTSLHVPGKPFPHGKKFAEVASRRSEARSVHSLGTMLSILSLGSLRELENKVVSRYINFTRNGYLNRILCDT